VHTFGNDKNLTRPLLLFNHVLFRDTCEEREAREEEEAEVVVVVVLVVLVLLLVVVVWAWEKEFTPRAEVSPSRSSFGINRDNSGLCRAKHALIAIKEAITITYMCLDETQ
jgi:hypothetical protein